MKTIFFITFIVLMLSMYSCVSSFRRDKIEYTAVDLEGRQMEVYDYKGPYVCGRYQVGDTVRVGDYSGLIYSRYTSGRNYNSQTSVIAIITSLK